MNKFQQNLFSILGATAILVVQSSVAIALSPDEINQIGREIAVRIDGQNSGTGAIVSREGNIYTVITNWHVVNSDGAYTIQTFDGQSYAVDYRQVKQLVGSDLALVSFTSDRDYNVPEIGNSDDLKEGQNVYIAGYPGSQSVAIVVIDFILKV